MVDPAESTAGEKGGLRPFRLTDFPAVFDFYAKAFRGSGQRKSDAFERIERGNPFRDESLDYLLYRVNDELVGYWGRMPMRFRVGGQTVEGVYSQEALVNPAFRRRGIASQLMAEVNGTPRLLVSLWHNDKTLAILKKSGWTDAGRFRPMKRLFSGRPLARRRFGDGWLAGAAGRVLDLVIRIRQPRIAAPADVEIRDMDRFDEAFDELFERAAPGLGVIADRSAATLNWKYVGLPHLEYGRLAAFRRGRLEGFLVFRFHTLDDGTRKGIIVDLLADPAADGILDGLAAEADRRFADAGMDFAVCLITEAAARDAWRRRGYYEGRAEPTDSLLVRNLEHAPQPEQVGRIEGWYLTYGDSDGDMW